MLTLAESRNGQGMDHLPKRQKKSSLQFSLLVVISRNIFEKIKKTKGKGEHVNLSAGDRTIETKCSADCTHGQSPKHIYKVLLYTVVALFVGIHPYKLPHFQMSFST